MRPVGAVCGLVLVLVLVGCGEDSPEPDAAATSATEIATTETDEAPAAAEIDPSVVADAADYEQRVDRQISIDGEPDFLTVDYGAVWVANFGTGTLDRVDPETHEVVKRIPVGDPCGAIASGFGSIWLLSCSGRPEIVRVDARTNRVAARISVTEIIPEAGIGVDESGAWALTAAAGELSRVDPKTNKIAGTYTVADGSTVVTAGFGSIWVANSNTNAVQRVDEASGQILATIPVGQAPRFMSAGEGALWVITQGDGDVHRVDPETNEVAAVIDVGDPFSGGDVKAGLGTVWAATGDGPLSRIDPATNEVVEHYEANGADAIGIGEGAIWIADHQVKTVFKLSPRPD